MAGRTDSAIALEVLAPAGVPEPQGSCTRFQDALAAHAPELTAWSASEASAARRAGAARRSCRWPRRTGRPVAADREHPGAGESEARRARAHRTPGPDIGAYGDISEVRGDLVPVARLNAAARLWGRLRRRATVLVGDTPSGRRGRARQWGPVRRGRDGRFAAGNSPRPARTSCSPDLADTALAISAILDGPTPRGRLEGHERPGQVFVAELRPTRPQLPVHRPDRQRILADSYAGHLVADGHSSISSMLTPQACTITYTSG